MKCNFSRLPPTRSGDSSGLRWADWMHSAPEKTTELLIATGNHILAQLKRNQLLLYDARSTIPSAIRSYMKIKSMRSGKAIGSKTVAARCGTSPPGAETELWQDHFRTLICVQHHPERFDTQVKDCQASEETAYYFCNLRLSAARFDQTVRDHWGVENRTHYVRDIRFEEYASRIRHDLCIFALLRSFTLNLIRFKGVKNISLGLYDNARASLGCWHIRGSSIEQPWTQTGLT